LTQHGLRKDIAKLLKIKFYDEFLQSNYRQKEEYVTPQQNNTVKKFESLVKLGTLPLAIFWTLIFANNPNHVRIVCSK
jgi:hypothetical protein